MIGPEGKPLEVQIRTRDMHQHSEYGVAAHWRYKEGAAAPRDPRFEDRIAWLRQVLDWKDAIADTSEWLAAFKQSLFTDTIYVLTPQGKVVDLPAGSTPVDFAYVVHTSLGHRCRGAKVNGRMVQLDHELASDVLVCSDDAEARTVVAGLAQAAGMQAYEAGGLDNGLVVEGLTALIIAMNKRYKSKTGGLRISGISR